MQYITRLCYQILDSRCIDTAAAIREPMTSPHAIIHATRTVIGGPICDACAVWVRLRNCIYGLAWHIDAAAAGQFMLALYERQRRFSYMRRLAAIGRNVMLTMLHSATAFLLYVYPTVYSYSVYKSKLYNSKDRDAFY